MTHTLIILHIVSGLRRGRGILSHDVVIHEGGAPEETETSGTAQNTAQDVLRGLLQPMTDGVLKLLIPYHRTWEGNRKRLDELLLFSRYSRV